MLPSDRLGELAMPSGGHRSGQHPSEVGLAGTKGQDPAPSQVYLWDTAHHYHPAPFGHQHMELPRSQLGSNVLQDWVKFEPLSDAVSDIFHRKDEVSGTKAL